MKLNHFKYDISVDSTISNNFLFKTVNGKEGTRRKKATRDA